MREYTIGRLKGKLVVKWTGDNGARRRIRLKATGIKAAEAEARDVILRETVQNTDPTVADLWPLYIAAYDGRPIATTIEYTGRALLPHFGALCPRQITATDCKVYQAKREAAGISLGSIWTELGHLRMVLSWSVKQRLIGFAPHITLPAKPAPRERHLSDGEVERLLASTVAPHIRVAILLMLTTAGRVGAILDLTWDRVNLDRGFVDLRIDPDRPRKGRAVVPINASLRAALTAAREAALTEYVIEYGGERIKSLKTGFYAAGRRAGIEDVSPHVLRHTAGVRMAGAGVAMSKISQYLGHSSVAMTEKVYARYQPDHLKDAGDALEIGPLRVVK